MNTQITFGQLIKTILVNDSDNKIGQGYLVNRFVCRILIRIYFRIMRVDLAHTRTKGRGIKTLPFPLVLVI